MTIFNLTIALLLLQTADAPNVESSSGATSSRFLLDTEIGGSGGVFVSGAVNSTVRDVFVTPGASARYRFASAPGPWSHLVLEGSLVATLAVGTDAPNALVAQLRAGASFPTWQATLGLWADVCLRCTPNSTHLNDGPRFPAQFVPSLSVRWQPAFWGLSAGVFDEAMGMIGHLDLRLGRWALGYSFPLGGLVAFQPKLSETIALDARLFGFTIAGGYQMGLTLGLAWLPRS